MPLINHKNKIKIQPEHEKRAPGFGARLGFVPDSAMAGRINDLHLARLAAAANISQGPRNGPSEPELLQTWAIPRQSRGERPASRGEKCNPGGGSRRAFFSRFRERRLENGG